MHEGQENREARENAIRGLSQNSIFKCPFTQRREIETNVAPLSAVKSGRKKFEKG